MKKLFAYKKLMIAILVIVSILASTSTFSYWAVSVQGESDETSMTFRIGEYIRTMFDFVLSDEELVYEYEVDIEYLLEDYENNKEEILFGIVWNDPNLSDEFKDRIVNGDIDVSFEHKFYENDEEVSAKTDRTLSRLLRIREDNNNPVEITYGDGAETFEFLLRLNQNKKLRDLEELLNYEVVIEITYTINY